jgi:RNA polymerase sigma factor (TIGR02999 family)
MSDVTRILSAIEHGDASSAEQLLPLVYDELRRLAAAKLALEKPGHTLQATALVHDAYIRLVDVDKAQHWDSRRHFFAAAAEAMRRILVEHARRQRTYCKGGHLRRQVLVEGEIVLPEPEELLELHEALERLASLDERKAKLVELRFFGGYTTAEAAQLLDISEATAERDWTFARAWLKREIDSPGVADS